jgi:hypothetical protein
VQPRRRAIAGAIRGISGPSENEAAVGVFAASLSSGYRRSCNLSRRRWPCARLVPRSIAMNKRVTVDLADDEARAIEAAVAWG